jgi:hypothetical protein
MTANLHSDPQLYGPVIDTAEKNEPEALVEFFRRAKIG